MWILPSSITRSTLNQGGKQVESRCFNSPFIVVYEWSNVLGWMSGDWCTIQNKIYVAITEYCYCTLYCVSLKKKKTLKT